MNLHGFLVHVSPGPLEGGDMTWKLYETRREGVTSVMSQISDDWTYKRLAFVLGEDLQDYCGLHGFVVYVRTNMPIECAKVRLGRHVLEGDFILCGLLNGDPIPLHTQGQAYEVVEWFIGKQELWHAIYPKQADGQAAKDTEAAQVDAGAGSSQRKAGTLLH